MVDASVIRADIKTAGFSVRTTLCGRTAEQTFQTEEARDAYVTRAERAGAMVEVLVRCDARK